MLETLLKLFYFLYTTLYNQHMILVEEITQRKLLPRDLLGAVKPFLKRPEAVVITGPRQAGKTSLLFLLAQEIIKKRKGRVFFYDLEFPEDLELLKDLSFPSSLPSGSYLFVDEIQYHPFPDRFIKLTVDHLKGKIKLIVSGSSSLEMKKRFREAMVGRKIEFVLLPLSFKELLLFKGKNDLLAHLKKISYKSISAYLEEYLTYGGYPAVVLENNRDVKKRLLGEIFTSYLYRDIFPLFKLKFLNLRNLRNSVIR